MKKCVFVALLGFFLNGHVQSEPGEVPGEASKLECSNGHKLFQVPSGHNSSLWVSAWMDDSGYLDSSGVDFGQSLWFENEDQTWKTATYFWGEKGFIVDGQCKTKGRGCTYKFSSSGVEIWKDVTCTELPYTPSRVNYDVELSGEYKMKIEATLWDFEGVPHLQFDYHPLEGSEESWIGLTFNMSGVERFGKNLVFLAAVVKYLGNCDDNGCSTGLEDWGEWKFHVTETSDGLLEGEYYFEGTPQVSAGKIVMKRH